MATNRKRIPRSRTSITMDESIKQYLLYGTAKRDTPAWSLHTSRHFDGYSGKIKAAWEEHRDALLPEWIRKQPCTRPWVFWKVEQTDVNINETQAAYLQRNGLLTTEERSYLKKHPELLEAETII